MSSKERKQRAFQARENLVIVEADELLKEHGYLGLNLDELAERVEYSKATLYHHFSSKEDLVLAVAIEHMLRRQDYFTRAALFRGDSREKMFGFGFADRLLSIESPHSFPLAQLVNTDSIWAKCSEARRKAFLAAADRCFDLGVTVAEEAKSRGDLSEWSPEPRQIVWGLVSISKGAHLMQEQEMFTEQLDANTGSMDYLFDSYHFYLDGLGWKPFSRDFDFAKTEERLKAELFAEEIDRIAD